MLCTPREIDESRRDSTRITVVSLFFSASCDQSPVITHISEEKIKEIGDEVQFNCTVQNLQDYPLLWIKLHKDRQDRSPLSSNTALIIRDSRFSVHVDTETSTNSLRVCIFFYRKICRREFSFYSRNEFAIFFFKHRQCWFMLLSSALKR